MKIVIAPSKTMKYQNISFNPTELLFPDQTQYLHTVLQQYNEEQLCELMKISYKQATQVYQYYHTKQTAYPALSFYQGTVFKQLELALYINHHDYLSKHLCILDAYYGVLKYNTMITPYRLDMTMKPQNINLYEYWYTPLYQYFEQVDFIISLASKEFTNMLRHPHIYFIDFIIINQGKIKRNAMIIKKARGQMLNQMILNEIKTLDELKTLNIDGFTYQPDYNQEEKYVKETIMLKSEKVIVIGIGSFIGLFILNSYFLSYILSFLVIGGDDYVLSYLMPIYSGIALIGAIIICCSYIIVKKINQLREEINK